MLKFVLSALITLSSLSRAQPRASKGNSGRRTCDACAVSFCKFSRIQYKYYKNKIITQKAKLIKIQWEVEKRLETVQNCGKGWLRRRHRVWPIYWFDVKVCRNVYLMTYSFFTLFESSSLTSLEVVFLSVKYEIGPRTAKPSHIYTKCKITFVSDS